MCYLRNTFIKKLKLLLFNVISNNIKYKTTHILNHIIMSSLQSDMEIEDLPIINLYNDNLNNILAIISTPSDLKKFIANHYVFGLDRSGSMADASNPDGTEGVELYTKLDLAIYAILIVIENINPDDILTIIVYDDQVEIIVENISITEKNKQEVIDKLKAIKPRGSTNLWEGLYTCLETVRNYELECKKQNNIPINSTIIFLTDGIPSESPPNGEASALAEYRKIKESKTEIITIGFGYDIKSDLLSQLGKFLFVPDGTMILTTFINFLAYMKHIYGYNTTVIIEGDNVINTCKVKSHYTVQTISSNCLKIDIGNILYDNKRDLLLSGKFNSMSVSFKKDNKYKTIFPLSDISKNCLIFGQQQQPKLLVTLDINKVKEEDLRIQSIGTLKSINKFGNINLISCKDELMKIIKVFDDKEIPILKDLIGQVSICLDDKYWKKWGKHYIIALITGHINQYCTNFKDPGLEIYKNNMYNYLIKNISSICDTLSVPEPSITKYNSVSGVPLSAPSKVAFTNYSYNEYGGCFGPLGIVNMEKGNKKYIKNIRKGDILEDGTSILCVIEYENAYTRKIFNGLEITDWHPILINGVWKFPYDLVSVKQSIFNKIVYNFVLDNKFSTIIVNDIHCCTLGHGFTGPVIDHKYYGTNQVIKDLQGFSGWLKGKITINSDNIDRDLVTNNVIGMHENNIYNETCGSNSIISIDMTHNQLTY